MVLLRGVALPSRARLCCAPGRAMSAVRAAHAPTPADSLIGGPGAVRDSAVLVTGGGMAGLGAATTLVRAGVDTLLVEQGRGAGGRVCTRRVRGQPLSFDHGCQYFAPKDGTAFAALMATLEAEGVVARWGERGTLGAVSCDAKTGRIDAASFTPHDASKKAWVAVPRMSAFGRHVLASAVAAPGAGKLTVAAGTRAAPGSLRRDGEAWLVDTHPKQDASATTTTRHRAVLAAGSASSTFNVIAPVAPQLAAAAGEVRANACWGLMVAFQTPLECGFAFDGALVSGSAAVAWAARDSSKPGRGGGFGGGAECWVVHATPEWSNERKALKAEEAARLLLIEWCKACGLHAATTQTLYCEAFLWNAAFPLNPAAPPEACFADAGLRLAMCGDWCVGPRAGDAWASGVAAANAIMRDML